MQTLLVFFSIIILLSGTISWVMEKFTEKSLSKRVKKVMQLSFMIFSIPVILAACTPEDETAIEKEIQPVVAVEESEAQVEKEKEAAEKKAEEERIAAEKKAAEEAEKLAAEKKAEEERIAAEKKAAEEKEKIAAQKKAEATADAERVAREQKAAEEKAAQAAVASASVASENFQNCTELRKVYPAGVPKGHAAYQSKMDRDNDNFACEA